MGARTRVWALVALLAGAQPMLTVTPCGAPGALTTLLEGFGLPSSFGERARMWERLVGEDEYGGTSAQNERLERAVLANLAELDAERPSLSDLLSLLGRPNDFLHRKDLYRHYVDRREAYRGSAAQNSALAAAIVDGMAAMLPTRVGMRAPALTGGGLPAEEANRRRLWDAQFPREDWEGTLAQERRLEERMAERWAERDWGTDLKDVLDYLGFRDSSNGRRILWERHRRRLDRNIPYRGNGRQDEKLAAWLVEDFAVGSASGGIEVLITAYNPLPEQTDDTPDITATGRRVREGYVAVSRDLEDRFPMGSTARLLVVCEITAAGDCAEDDGRLFEVEVQDRMHRRKTNQVDIFLMCEPDALEFGRRRGVLLP